MGTINRKTITKYSGRYPAMYIEHCMEGGSTPEFCNLVRVSYQTFDRWCKIYPAMRRAKEEGKKLAEGWWLSQGRQHLIEDYQGPKLNTSLYKFVMGGRFGHTSDKSALDAIEELQHKIDEISSKVSSSDKLAKEPEYDTVDETIEGTR